MVDERHETRSSGREEWESKDDVGGDEDDDVSSNDEGVRVIKLSISKSESTSNRVRGMKRGGGVKTVDEVPNGGRIVLECVQWRERAVIEYSMDFTIQ